MQKHTMTNKIKLLTIILAITMLLCACGKTTGTTDEIPTQPKNQTESDQVKSFDEIFNEFKTSMDDIWEDDDESEIQFGIQLNAIKDMWKYVNKIEEFDSTDDNLTKFLCAIAYLTKFFDEGSGGYALGDAGWDFIEALSKNDTVQKDLCAKEFEELFESIFNEKLVSEDILSGRTLGEQNAYKKAQQYMKSMSFSRQGLIEQLEFEGYSNEEAVFAVDNGNFDWMQAAADKAAQYLKSMSFSRQGLIEQLEFEGFTPEQAEYGVTQVGY